MLRIGLTGGIGAGKSTVSATFSECGGIVVDGDVIAREVVEPGTTGLTKLVESFGPQILRSDGALDRPALAAIAFSDENKRQTLNGIVHPLVAHRRSELIAAAAEDAVIVEDIPLLVESQMAPMFPLVVIVDADPEVRVQRLIDHRGFSEADARARIAAQATEEQRRRVADVWLDNAGTAGHLAEQARELWYQRILPFAHNLASGRPTPDPDELVPADPSWPVQAERIRARLNTACGHRALRIDHIGSTAVSGMDARDIIDVQVSVASPDLADELTDDLLRAGYPRVGSVTADRSIDGSTTRSIDGSTTRSIDGSTTRSIDGSTTLWPKRLHASADPGRPTHIHIRPEGSPNQRFALLFVDWLNANPGVRSDYLEAKRAGRTAAWILDAYGRAESWADGTGWSPAPVS